MEVRRKAGDYLSLLFFLFLVLFLGLDFLFRISRTRRMTRKRARIKY
jgi:hypothetical protein